MARSTLAVVVPAAVLVVAARPVGERKVAVGILCVVTVNAVSVNVSAVSVGVHVKTAVDEAARLRAREAGVLSALPTLAAVVTPTPRRRLQRPPGQRLGAV